MHAATDPSKDGGSRPQTNRSWPGASDWLGYLFDEVGSGIAVCRAVDDGQDIVFADLNRAGERTDRIRRTDVLGRGLTEIFPNVADIGRLDVLRRVWRSGTPESHPLNRYRDTRISGWRKNRVLRLPSGEVVAIYDDRTDEVTIGEAEAQQALMEAELNHRVRNLLVSIEAMMRNAARNAASHVEFAATFPGRLEAIARGNECLLTSDALPATLAALLNDNHRGQWDVEWCGHV